MAWPSPPTLTYGKLEQVLFKEDEHRKGDVLAKIDPRLYQAALDNAKAQKAKDEAQVISARKDLQRSSTLVNQFFETKQVVDQQQAKVDQVVVAPSDGRIGVRMIDPGNIVHASDSSPIVTLTLTKPSAVMFTLSASSLNDVRDAMARGPVHLGQSLPTRADAYVRIDHKRKCTERRKRPDGP
jgi:membrane fusion protein, multidrug efflux system